jgi:hypothetical protein
MMTADSLRLARMIRGMRELKEAVRISGIKFKPQIKFDRFQDLYTAKSTGEVDKKDSGKAGS